jgi:hypothetical protein
MQKNVGGGNPFKDLALILKGFVTLQDAKSKPNKQKTDYWLVVDPECDEIVHQENQIVQT